MSTGWMIPSYLEDYGEYNEKSLAVIRNWSDVDGGLVVVT
jgi:hypothetical protein